MKIKIRQLPDGNNYFQNTDFFVIAQSSGGQVTRKLTASQLAGKLYISGSYCSIVNQRIDVNAAGINALLDPRFNAIEARLGALEGKMNNVESQMGNIPPQAPTTVFYDSTDLVGGGQGAQQAGNNVVNVVKQIFNTLPPNSTVNIKWKRYWTYGRGNGTASAANYAIDQYRVVNGTNWTFIKKTELS